MPTDLDQPSLNPSLWEQELDRSAGSPVPVNLAADVCIVGAGIAGMTTAYLLSRAGKRVAIFDDGPIGGGETKHTTAHLTHALDDRYFEAEKIHGEERSKLIAASHTAAIDRIEAIVREEEIECGFSRVDGYLFLGRDDEESTLDKELAAAHRAGLTAVEKLGGAPQAMWETGPCLRFPQQAQFHPLEYLSGLKAAILRAGGQIFPACKIKSMIGGDDAHVVTEGGVRVSAGSVVVATNSPVNDLFATHTKQAPYRTYVVAFRIPPGSVQRALFWDTEDPYHYIRIYEGGADGDFLIVGGEDHKTGHDTGGANPFGVLEAWSRKRFPMAQEVTYRWSGQVMETVDGLAYIGRNPADADNVYIATGDSGMGMTHGTIAGMLISDLILGRENPWEELYDPGRKRLKGSALIEFAKENLDVAAQYTDYLKGGEIDDESELKPGEGALMFSRLKKMAVYRDAEGVVHRMSAVCPHLKCIVRWNFAERTWDCPCHGSRFDCVGRVLNGPANSDLPPV
jgi:glycine/D-amino acid oxidase-like deaminating enzyme/nitrite reductase/ring-hydroxylating ferredoxin subunit